MSKQRNTLIALTLAAACGFGVYKAGSALIADEAQGTEHAVNQVWIDHIPRNDRDMIAHMVLVDHREGQFGAIGRSSQWRHMIDVFKWQLRGDSLRVFFPQERARGQVKIETWECQGEAPAPFELCMRMTAKNGESAMLYSRHDWKVEPGSVEDSLEDLREDTPALAHLPVFEDGQAASFGAAELDEDSESWPLRELF